LKPLNIRPRLLYWINYGISYPKASGLAFSVGAQHKIHPSLKNIFKEIIIEKIPNFAIPSTSDLSR